MIKYKTGIDLVGSNVEVWQNGKYGRFNKVGKVIKYLKSKTPKKEAST